MLANLLTQIYNLKWLIVGYLVVAILFSFLISSFGKRFEWNKKKILSFAFLYTMDKRHLVAYSLSLGRFLYVIYLAVFCKQLGIESFGIFMVFSILISIFGKDLKGLPGQLITYACLFGVLLLESMFYGYYTDVESFWLIMAMVVFLGSFASLYSLYHQILTHERLSRLSCGDETTGTKEMPMNINDFKDLFKSNADEEGVSIIDVQKKA